MYTMTKFQSRQKLRAEVLTTFGSKVVIFSAARLVIEKHTKFANFVLLYFPYSTTFRDLTLQFYYFCRTLFLAVVVDFVLLA